MEQGNRVPVENWHAFGRKYCVDKTSHSCGDRGRQRATAADLFVLDTDSRSASSGRERGLVYRCLSLRPPSRLCGGSPSTTSTAPKRELLYVELTQGRQAGATRKASNQARPARPAKDQ